MSKITLRERVAQLEVKVENLIEAIRNHASAHLFDRTIQSVTLLGMVLIIYLLKITVFK